MTKVMKNCHECVVGKKGIIKQKMEEKRARLKSWFGLIEKVKKGPISDIICLIPKIRHVDLFGDIFKAKHVTEFQQDYLSVFKLMVKHKAPTASWQGATI